jgi:hypothetical protein
MMFCSKCGKQLDDGAAFCSECGTATSGKDAKQETVQPAITPQKKKRPLKNKTIYAWMVASLIGLIVIANIFGRGDNVTDASATSSSSSVPPSSSSIAPSSVSVVAPPPTSEAEIATSELESALDDVFIDGPIWASQATDVDKFKYKLNPYEGEVVIESYGGEDKKVWISDTYTIDGKEYRTQFYNNAVFASGKITSAIVPEGVSFIENNTFNSTGLEYLYLPSTLEPLEGGYHLFKYTHDIKKVYFGGSHEQWQHITQNLDPESMKYIAVFCNAVISENNGNVSITGDLYELPSIYAPKLSLEEFKESAESPTFEELSRYPDTYKTTPIKVTVYVKSVDTDKWLGLLQGGYLCTMNGQELVVFDNREVREPRLLEGDTVTIYGYGGGLYKRQLKQQGLILDKVVEEWYSPEVRIEYVLTD